MGRREGGSYGEKKVFYFATLWFSDDALSLFLSGGGGGVISRPKTLQFYPFSRKKESRGENFLLFPLSCTDEKEEKTKGFFP